MRDSPGSVAASWTRPVPRVKSRRCVDDRPSLRFFLYQQNADFRLSRTGQCGGDLLYVLGCDLDVSDVSTRDGRDHDLAFGVVYDVPKRSAPQTKTGQGADNLASLPGRGFPVPGTRRLLGRKECAWHRFPMPKRLPFERGGRDYRHPVAGGYPRERLSLERRQTAGVGQRNDARILRAEAAAVHLHRPPGTHGSEDRAVAVKRGIARVCQGIQAAPTARIGRLMPAISLISVIKGGIQTADRPVYAGLPPQPTECNGVEVLAGLARPGNPPQPVADDGLDEVRCARHRRAGSRRRGVGARGAGFLGVAGFRTGLGKRSGSTRILREGPGRLNPTGNIGRATLSAGSNPLKCVWCEQPRGALPAICRLAMTPRSAIV